MMNIGATVVTSSSEMIRGLVSVTRSRGQRRLRLDFPRLRGLQRRARGVERPARTSAAQSSGAHQQVQRPEPGGEQVQDHGRGHRDLDQRDGQHDGRRSAAPRAVSMARDRRSRLTSSPSTSQEPKREHPVGPVQPREGAVGWRGAPVAEGKAQAKKAGVEVGDLGPEEDDHEPEGRRGEHQPVVAVTLLPCDWGRGPPAPARRPITRSVARSTIAFARWMMTTQGGRTSLTVTAPRRTCTTSRNPARSGGVPQRGLAPMPDASATTATANTSGAHQRRGPAVADLDEGREVERREPLAVAAWPVVAAPHAGPGDPDDAAKDDEPEGEGRCRPRPDGGAVEAGPAGWF